MCTCVRPCGSDPGCPAQVRRFVKYNLGEGMEKKKSDFAAEVAQQTQAKAAPVAVAPPAAAAAPKVEEKKKPAVEVGSFKYKSSNLNIKCNGRWVACRWLRERSEGKRWH